VTFTRSFRPGQLGKVEGDGDGRTVEVRLVAWNTPSEVTDDGRTFYREQFSRGGLVPAGDKLLVTNGHNGPVIGRIRSIENREDGAYAQVRVAATGDGQDLIALLDDEIIEHVSIEFDDGPSRARSGELVTRSRAVLTGLAFTLTPQHNTARVLARRSMEEPMSDQITPTEPDEPVEPEPTEPEPAVLTRSLPARSSAGVRQLQPAATPVAPAPARYRSFGDFLVDAVNGRLPSEERQQYYRALATATTADAPSLVQTQWIQEIIDLRKTRTPVTSMFSQRPLPDSGLVISQPKVSQRPLIGLQASELAAIASQKVTYASVSWTVKTYAGGQETSMQLIDRSDPSYMEAAYRLYLQEMDLKLEADVAAAVLAASIVTNTVPIEMLPTPNFIDAFIDAAAVLLAQPNIQSMPDVCGLSVQMWQQLAKAKDTTGRGLFMGLSPFNASGSMSLATPDGSINTLEYSVVPSWAGKVAVVGIKDAFRTMLGGVQTLQADVPNTLARDQAVFQYAAFGAVDEAGLVKIVDAV
jgi:HK97 family phage major capsid protein